MLCPCGSLKPYTTCCEPYHLGQPAPNALALMRSRYSAFSLGLVDYLIQTAQSPGKREDLEKFIQDAHFLGLEIIDFVDGDKKAFVTFKPTLSYSGKKETYVEKSLFEKEKGRWIYIKSLFDV